MSICMYSRQRKLAKNKDRNCLLEKIREDINQENKNIKYMSGMNNIESVED